MMPPMLDRKNQKNCVGASPRWVPSHSGADSTYRNMPLNGTPLASTSSQEARVAHQGAIAAQQGPGANDWRCRRVQRLGQPAPVASTSSSRPTPDQEPEDRMPARRTNSSPPITGAMAGATPKKIVTCDITRCASAGGNMSRMMARDTTTPAPADMPCSARKAISCADVLASAQPTEPA
jgi:hypothetical protein